MVENRIKNKTVVITGASKGLGMELAYAFSEKEANCVLCARSDKLDRVVDEINAKSGTAVGIKSDISLEETAFKLVEAADSNYSSLDIWINNAGILIYGGIGEIDAEEMQRVFEVNVKGTIYCCREALRYMKKKGRGHILNVISTAGKEGKKNESVYVASKFAITGFTESLRQEAYPSGIRVSAFYPGGMKTQLFEKSRPDLDTSNFMDTREVAELVVNLANLPGNMLPMDFVLKRM